MLFSQTTYVERRRRLRELVGDGIIVIFGNNNSPMNYPNNGYKFRQDSSFLYFTGQHREGLVLVIDCNSGKEILFGDEVSIDDIVWYGKVKSAAEMAEESGISELRPYARLHDLVAEAKGRTIHYLPPYRHENMIAIMNLLGIKPEEQKAHSSVTLIKAIVALRSIKSEEEIAELERAAAIGYKMHTTAMKLVTKPGMTEAYISGVIEGIACSLGSNVSFGNIVTMHGEIMHGCPSPSPLEPGRLLLVDAGAETFEHYCSDNTRTMPISGRFTQKQRDIVQIVADCHDLALTFAKPGLRWYDTHMAVCRLMTERLKDLGLMKGNTDDAVAAGAHAMFMPHGLGHMMGMDVHDMEGLGQNYVGYDDTIQPSDQFGLASLRFARKLEVGHVITDEPGIYFIPDLIDDWYRNGINADFICFDKVNEYRDFGGVRIEDDVLITPDGCRFLGEDRVPYHPADVEEFIANNKE
ncbi:MAG: aminopeptidase P family protein [bacterium]|nr:aminopeptidase P family protein [bacterium]